MWMVPCSAEEVGEKQILARADVGVLRAREDAEVGKFL